MSHPWGVDWGSEVLFDQIISATALRGLSAAICGSLGYVAIEYEVYVFVGARAYTRHVNKVEWRRHPIAKTTIRY